jgi:hypothetical protein
MGGAVHAHAAVTANRGETGTAAAHAAKVSAAATAAAHVAAAATSHQLKQTAGGGV